MHKYIYKYMYEIHLFKQFVFILSRLFFFIILFMTHKRLNFFSAVVFVLFSQPSIAHLKKPCRDPVHL